jgi:hypothetical protein
MASTAAQHTSIPDISLTTFVDFVIASGTPRLTCIKNAKAMYDAAYQPPFDFYKQLRECIIQMHSEGHDTNALEHFIKANRNLKKDARYRECAGAYKKWLGRRDIAWIGCETVKWQSGDLSVRVNPELGLRIDGTDYLIKLYFKQPQPSKLRLDTMLHLLKTARGPKHKSSVPAILDVPRGKLIVPTVDIDGLDALLAGEAAAFAAMWRAV